MIHALFDSENGRNMSLPLSILVFTVIMKEIFVEKFIVKLTIYVIIGYSYAYD